MLTPKKAKQETLVLWEYLARSGSDNKDTSPLGLEVYKYIARCPLCELYYIGGCFGCPLYESGNGCDGNKHSYFNIWVSAETKKIRKKYAEKICKIVKAWRV